jgi:hypothetical protein
MCFCCNQPHQLPNSPTITLYDFGCTLFQMTDSTVIEEENHFQHFDIMFQKATDGPFDLVNVLATIRAINFNDWRIRSLSALLNDLEEADLEV